MSPLSLGHTALSFFLGEALILDSCKKKKKISCFALCGVHIFTFPLFPFFFNPSPHRVRLILLFLAGRLAVHISKKTLWETSHIQDK